MIIWLETKTIFAKLLAFSLFLSCFTSREKISIFPRNGANISWCTVVFSVFKRCDVSSCCFNNLYVVMSVKFRTWLSLPLISSSHLFTIRVFSSFVYASWSTYVSSCSSEFCFLLRSSFNDIISSCLFERFSSDLLNFILLNYGTSIARTALDSSSLIPSTTVSLNLNILWPCLLLNKNYGSVFFAETFSNAIIASLWAFKT